MKIIIQIMITILYHYQLIILKVSLFFMISTLFLIILQTNPVYSIFSFIITAVAVFSFLLLIGAEFFALLVLIIYLGVITVLFIFVVIMYNLRLLDLNILQIAKNIINPFF
jgi:NADH:ubiquinone oxidoreductase subunit 6 (subunit J)